MMPLRNPLRQKIGSRSLMRQCQPSSLARATMMMLLCSAASAGAVPPGDNGMAVRRSSQFSQPAAGDSYPRSMQRSTPYDSDDSGDPIWAGSDSTIEDAGTPEALGGAQNAEPATGRSQSIARAMNYSVEPQEIVPSTQTRNVDGSRDVPIINTQDPLALAAAIVNGKLQGVSSATARGPSPFIAGQCLYYSQDITIQGLPSGCR